MEASMECVYVCHCTNCDHTKAHDLNINCRLPSLANTDMFALLIYFCMKLTALIARDVVTGFASEFNTNMCANIAAHFKALSRLYHEQALDQVRYHLRLLCVISLPVSRHSHATCIRLQRFKGLDFPTSALIFDFECNTGPSVKLTTRVALKCLACPTWKYMFTESNVGSA